MSSILDMLGVDAEELSSINNDPDLHQRALGNITRVQAGKRVKTNLTLNGIQFPGFVTLHEASLTRLSYTEGAKRDGSAYAIVGGTLNPVKMDVELNIDGETINLIDVLHEMANAAAPDTKQDRQQFISFLTDKLNMDILNGMSLTFEHLGSDINAYAQVVELMKSVGAVNDVEVNRKKYINRTTGELGRVRQAWVVPTGVIPVTSFEVGGKDREQTDLFRNAGVKQGFIDFADAVFENMRRLIKFDKEYAAMKALQLDKSGKISQDELNQIEMQIKMISSAGRKWANLWNGSKQRYQQVTPGEYRPLYTWDPANADVGRMSIIVNGDEHKADFWTNSNNATTVAPEASSVPTPASVMEALGNF